MGNRTLASQIGDPPALVGLRHASQCRRPMLQGHGDDATSERNVTEPIEHGRPLVRELGMRIGQRERLAVTGLRVLVGKEARRA